MKSRLLVYIICLSVLTLTKVSAQDIFRFQHYDSEDGLSQNSVSSVLCDKDGFLWIGTMNGLNRFDGYEFKVFNNNTKDNSFINNRVIQLWQDHLGYIWIETYDHYYHFFNPITEKFSTIPNYNNSNYEKNNLSTCFLQYSEDEIWIGTSENGLYYLKHDVNQNIYNRTHISDKGRFTITNNEVRFIYSDENEDIWAGTKRGIDHLQKKDLQRNVFNFQHYLINYSFNSAIEIEDEIWFASDKKGIVTYNKTLKSFNFLNNSNTEHFKSDEINRIFASSDKKVLVAFKNKGLTIYNSLDKTWSEVKIHGNNVEKIYFDRFDNAWVTTEEYGVTKVNLSSLESKSYQLTNQNQKSITDRERHVFYEDKDSNLWIGLHGGALAFYNRQNDYFTKYTNNPSDNYSISSNIVHSITEDLSGQMWLGTGQYKGGLEKVIKRNSAFKHIIPTKNHSQIIDNVTRSIVQDPNKNIWLSTKNGIIHIYNTNFEKIHTINSLKINNNKREKVNVYKFFIDKNKHIWLGTKGHGIAVSTSPLPSKETNYKSLQFYNYRTIANDSTSIPNDNIYSIEQDLYGNIWIGTYGNGICKVLNNEYKDLSFKSYNSSNSNLSSDLVRKIKCDSDSNLWVATAFGLNVLKKDSLKNPKINFQSFFKEADNPDKINYNDIVEIFEDSNRQLWFGTFGGGISTIQLPIKKSSKFKNFTTKDGLSNDVIFGILEDDQKRIWISSEYGLSRYNSEEKIFEMYNESNGLSINNFSENTSYKLSDGRLLFGGSKGLESIKPELIKETTDKHLIKLTNFQLFNKDVNIGTKNSPLKKSISFTKAIKLPYNYSSFSLEYSALDFLDPSKIQYAYKLEGFEENWNFVGNQTKATYTNLSPGKYTFRVKNTKRNGEWSHLYKELTVTITSPWWKTTGAYISYAILLTIIILIVRRIIIRINKFRTDLVLVKKINELKLQFFTNISHEIRTPLTLILGPLDDLLSEGQVINNEVISQLKMMKRNTRRMLALVNQLLDFRRIQNNKMSLNIKKIELNKFTLSIYESFIPLAKHNGITLEIDPYDTEIIVWADAEKLDSIIYNLISNALKFTPKSKGVKIDISKNNEFALINVKDEGQGIANEDISDIFTRFVILNKSHSQGSGIGLALAYELAKLHNGDIKITSQIDRGSCFCFSLPLDNKQFAKQENLQIIEKSKSRIPNNHIENSDIPTILNESPQLDKNKPTILLVEDNVQISSYLKNKLEKGYNCIVAENGKRGLKLAEIHNPDVIVTDIMMPEIDGIEMTKKLKENFSLCHIPIVIMTAKNDIQDKIEGYSSGAEAYITKPLNTKHLSAIVDNLIGQRKLVISKFRDNKTIDPNTLKVNTKDEEFLTQLLGHIKSNFSEDLSVENVAETFCMSRTVLYNKIKGLTGLSPLEFIRQVKLKLSLNLLKKGYSVSETAYKIGYTDVKYFSKQFKKTFGYTPSQIKKELK